MIATTLLALLILLQAADYYTTRIILIRGRRELNPCVAAGIELFGRDIFLFLKGLVVTWFGWELMILAPWALAILVFVYLLVILHNCNVLSKGSV